MVAFKDPYSYKTITEHFVAVEGMYSGQYIYCGKKASINIGNILPVGLIPEGTLICNVEQSRGDKGKLAKTSGAFATIIAQSEDGLKTRIKLPSGVRKTIDSKSRAMVGIVSGRSK